MFRITSRDILQVCRRKLNDTERDSLPMLSILPSLIICTLNLKKPIKQKCFKQSKSHIYTAATVNFIKKKSVCQLNCHHWLLRLLVENQFFKNGSGNHWLPGKCWITGNVRSPWNTGSPTVKWAIYTFAKCKVSNTPFIQTTKSFLRQMSC